MSCLPCPPSPGQPDMDILVIPNAFFPLSALGCLRPQDVSSCHQLPIIWLVKPNLHHWIPPSVIVWSLVTLRWMDPKDSAFTLVGFLAIFNTCLFLFEILAFHGLHDLSLLGFILSVLFILGSFLSSTLNARVQQIYSLAFSTTPFPPCVRPPHSFITHLISYLLLQYCYVTNYPEMQCQTPVSIFRVRKLRLYEKNSRRHKWHEPLNLITAFSTVLRELRKKETIIATLLLSTATAKQSQVPLMSLVNLFYLILQWELSSICHNYNIFNFPSFFKPL